MYVRQHRFLDWKDAMKQACELKDKSKATKLSDKTEQPGN